MTREEASRLLSQFARNVLCRTPHITYNASYVDVDGADMTLMPYIKDAYELGIFKGHKGMFRPKDMITQQEFASAVMRLLTHNIDTEMTATWWESYQSIAKTMGLFDASFWDADNNVRKEAIYKLFSAYKNYDYTRESYGYVITQ